MDSLISLSLSYFLAVILMVSAIKKFSDAQRFKGVMAQYGALASKLSPYFVGLVELGAAVTLLIPSQTSLGALMALVIFFGYGAALAWQFAKGNASFDCGCSWSREKSESHPIILSRNVLLISLAAVLLLPALPRELTAFDYINGALCVIALLPLYYTLDVLLAIYPTTLRREI